MNETKRVIALGFFDGVHNGHAALMRRTVQVAQEIGATPSAFTFDPHPQTVILGKPMSEHLPFAMAWWHNMCAAGTDMFGRDTADKSFGAEKGTMAHAKAKVDAGFEFMQKLGVEYFYFHDVDIVPEADDIKETNKRLDEISDYILKLGATLSLEEYDHPSEDVWIAKDAKVAPTAYIGGPCIIDHGAEIRHCAFIRGNALVGKGTVVGNSTELKNVILFDNVQVPHYNYVGDSILGYKSHMGAGSITSNVKSDKTLVVVKDCYDTKEEIETGLKKFGAMLGDHAEIGCNSVLCPGSIIGRNTTVYPLSRVRGVIPADSIFKSADHIVRKH